ncbi:hypothetical protein HYC85_012587 [Camellia sinensis]|uniref:Cullin N-terminal domain-containing protein n=1 Tax=Camellia sinensis TaxID=4442 RepID=A0A7J7HF84_CAMSI|nr:hypothetical protein HYC85_012587 [Camellia sinensis]
MEVSLQPERLIETMFLIGLPTLPDPEVDSRPEKVWLMDKLKVVDPHPEWSVSLAYHVLSKRPNLRRCGPDADHHHPTIHPHRPTNSCLALFVSSSHHRCPPQGVVKLQLLGRLQSFSNYLNAASCSVNHRISEIVKTVDVRHFKPIRNTYNMVLHKFGEKLYFGLVLTMTSYLKEMAKSTEAAQKGLFLEELNGKWADHNKALQIIQNILMYMDRTFIPSTHKTLIHELALNLWRDNIIHTSKIQPRLQDTLLELLQRERTGEVLLFTKKILRYLFLKSQLISIVASLNILLSAVIVEII